MKNNLISSKFSLRLNPLIGKIQQKTEEKKAKTKTELPPIFNSNTTFITHSKYLSKKHTKVLNINKTEDSENLKAYKEMAQKSLKKLIEEENEEIPMSDESDEIIDKRKQLVEDIDNMQGEEGIESFHNQYKFAQTLGKLFIPEKYKNSPAVQYLDSLNSFKILPRPSGIVRKAGSKNELIINKFGLGDHFASSIGKSIQASSKLDSVSISEGRITNTGAINLIANLPMGIKHLDLSSNFLHQESYKQISDILINPSRMQSLQRLTELNLEGNQGKDQGIKILFNSLSENSTLTHLNISKNGITDKGSEFIGAYLRKNLNLKVLLFHWNKITGKGGLNIANSLFTNRSLLVLDGSFNSMGLSIHNQSAIEFKKLFIENKSLIHIDLSHNSFNEMGIQLLSEGLLENHSILGIHLIGNNAIVDSNGFVKPIKNNIPSISHIYSRLSMKLEMGSKTSKKLARVNTFNKCWICEGWSPLKFTFHPLIFKMNPLENTDKLYIHFDFDDFSPVLMTKDENEIYYINKMVPPGNIKYFYSINKNKFFTDPNREIQEIKEKYGSEKLSKYSSILEVKKANIIKGIVRKEEVISENILDEMKCLPRVEHKEDELIIQKPAWAFNKSIFKNYFADNEELLLRCFEYDWSHTKVEKIFKNDLSQMNEVKTLMKKYYKVIRDIYKYHSALDPCNTVFAISENVIFDIVKKSNAIDNDSLKTSDVNLEFITTNTMEISQKSSKLNPERFLIRYEFLEFLIRIGMRKFKKFDDLSKAQACSKFMEENIIPKFQNYDCNIWRKERLWNENCDNVLKKYLNLINILFNNYSGRNSLPNKPKHVSIEEFVELIGKANLINDKFGSRELIILYNLSMMTQVQELDDDRHLCMNIDEFIEVLARVADKVVIETPYEVYIKQSEKLPYTILESLPLYLKIKNLLETLMKKCLNRDEMEQMQKQIFSTAKI